MLMPGEYVLWGAVCSDDDEKDILAAEKHPFTVKGVENPFGVFWNQARWDIINHDGPRDHVELSKTLKY
jgi:hypothetical protein